MICELPNKRYLLPATINGSSGNIYASEKLAQQLRAILSEHPEAKIIINTRQK